jgi:hypothetical protein
MKTGRILPAVLCALAMASGSLYAQEPRRAISVDLFLPAASPISRLSGEDMTFIPLNVMYQRVLGERQVLMLKMGLTYSWSDDGEKSLDVYPMLALHWHPFDTGLKGFYFGPSLFLDYTDNSYSGTAAADDLNYSYWSAAGVNVGYQFARRSNIVVDLIFGLGYGYSKEVDVSGKESTDYRVDETIGGVFVGCRF